MYKLIQQEINLGHDRTITIETGKLAKQADGSVLVKQGDTMLLATVVAAKEAKEDVDYMPLSVEYKEKYASTGRFPGGFFKRETRPSEHEILTSRLVDRALRPMFPDNFHAETFVTITLVSADKDIMPDALAGLAASAAISVSDVPFNGPISEVRVSRINGELKINPAFSENENADIDIIVAANFDNVIMVEGEMNEVSEKEMLEAIKFAHEAIKLQCQAQQELAKKVNKPVREYEHEKNDEELRKKLHESTYNQVYELVQQVINDKHERHNKIEAIKEAFINSFPEAEEINTALIDKYFHDIEKEALRNLLFDKGIRIDGRKPDEIRDIWCEVNTLPAAHGSALFTRGETQSLTTITLGTKLDEQVIDGVVITGTDRFQLHYNFPPFSTGDARPVRFVSRREVGHGNLARRALERMIPDTPEDNPYTVRVVSDILESNGSSSMATVCAGTLALMDGGIKLKRPVSGIAMGLVTDTDSGKYIILSDILGDEDHLGDMDFKVAGTSNGITACQMDIKVEGLSYQILEQALEQAKQGRMYILDKMLEVISQPREDFKPHAPRIHKIIVDKEFIGAIIGPGGKVVQEIQAETGTTIVIEEVEEKGIVDVVASDKDSIDAAIERIKAIIAVPEVNEIYKGKVKSILPYGAFVEILPGKDGLLHISEIEWKRVNAVTDIFKEGDEVEVKLIDIDKDGKLRLSRKALLPRPDSGDKDKGNQQR